MYYILCEGEAGKSEYCFIEAVIQEFKGNNIVTLDNSNGNRGIRSWWLKNKSRINSEDIFVLVFDMVETVGSLPVSSILKSIHSDCESIGCSFYYTTYYCFEELFLSYDGIFDISKLAVRHRNVINAVHKSFRLKGNYYEDLPLSIYAELVGDAIKYIGTREKLSATLASILLSKTCGQFKLTKSEIGNCWVTDCDEVCSRCTYRCRGGTFRDKLYDLELGSVGKDGILFSELFDV